MQPAKAYKTKAKKRFGFLKKMSTKSGQNILKNRRLKGRKKLTP